MHLKFWGTRGSVPVPGKSTLKYGGNTPCVEIRSDNNKMLILDGGTGIRELGNQLLTNHHNDNIKILLTHYHWDHIQGIPFFLPLYQKGRKIFFYGMSIEQMHIDDFLNLQMTPKNFPIQLNEVNAEVVFKKVYPEKELDIDGLKIETLQANHSAPTLTYKISDGSKSIVYLTDNELKSFDVNDFNQPPTKSFMDDNSQLIEFCKGCTYLIHDTMYDETSIKDKTGWGHSANIPLAYFSILAQVENLVLFHYNPEHTDSKVDALLEETKQILEQHNSKINCIAAQEGMEIEF